MKTSVSKYLLLIGFHIVLAFLVINLKILSLVYFILVLVYGVFSIINNKDRNDEALYFAAYCVGIEVFLRMTKGILFYETGKYTVILFMILGMFYKGINKQAGYYFIYMLLLLPAIIITVQDLSHEYDIRNAIMFNLSGPLCLGISAMYCVEKEIPIQRFIDILFAIGLPIVTTAVYLFLYTPNIRDVVTNTGSNFATSGGFGPNQVATVLGLGIFVFFVQILFRSKNKLLLIVNVVLLALITYRGIITFSRGGILTALIAILILVVMMLYIINKNGKRKLTLIIISGVFFLSGIWIYSSLQTGGLIENRYRNEDSLGREKESTLSGRENLIASELKMFYENPAFGVGVGRNKEVRLEDTGITAASHNELSRILAEHGSFGIFGLFILIVVPLAMFNVSKENVFVISFFMFWMLTISHAAMRIAIPAFVYALSLIKVRFDENTSIHR
jgi:O-antigen ligase